MSDLPSSYTNTTQPSQQKAAEISEPSSTTTTTTTTAAAAAPLPDNASGSVTQPAAPAAGPAELARRQMKLQGALRQFPDFPIAGINFVDILPLFADAALHAELLVALELQVLAAHGGAKPDVVVALDARGFLFGPSLALRLNCAFVPVRKKGKLPGPVETASFKKEYGEDYFQMQKDGVKPGQVALIVDDIIATGGSAAAAGALVEQLGGKVMGYLFILELDFLKGRDKLSAPVHTLLSAD